MKKVILMVMVVGFVFALTGSIMAVDLSDYEYIDGVWMENPVYTEFGYVPDCVFTRIELLPDGTFFQEDPCINDPWGNDYAPWGTSGGAGAGE
jgi:hypothetical protein